MPKTHSVIALAVAGLALGAGVAPALARQSPGPIAAADRPVQVLADGWRFQLDPAAIGPEQEDFDDSAWASVAVPHSWNRVGFYRTDTPERLNRPETIDKTMGVGWYRLNFSTPSGFAGKRLWLEFDAASRTAEVWLNGVRLGAHAGGFSRFRFDATAAIRPGQRNLLAVRVDNSKPAPGSATADVLPLSGDFFVHGGLYRAVRLIVTDAVHVDMLDHGGSGIAATTEAISPGRAVVRVATRLRNDGGSASPVAVTARLVDHLGRTAATATTTVPLATAGSGQAEQTLTIARPRLWAGTV
ncbi:sugar-binding domain-containing protein, partial [Novosphingobium aerophilum]